jgi:alcohol dehydrogenase (cytochrome c)
MLRGNYQGWMYSPLDQINPNNVKHLTLERSQDARSASSTRPTTLSRTCSRASTPRPAGRRTTRSTSRAPASALSSARRRGGGKAWPYEAYNPDTGMVYIPANDNHCGSLEGKVQEYVAGQRWTGVDSPDIGFTVIRTPSRTARSRRGTPTPASGNGTHLYPVMNWGSILTTAGGLVFNGGTNDRMFRAFDARTGEQLWRFNTNSGTMAPPSSFEVDGTQYIAVVSGWGGSLAFQQRLINAILGTELVVPRCGVIWVFALGQ